MTGIGRVCEVLRMFQDNFQHCRKVLFWEKIKILTKTLHLILKKKHISSLRIYVVIQSWHKCRKQMHHFTFYFSPQCFLLLFTYFQSNPTICLYPDLWFRVWDSFIFNVVPSANYWPLIRSNSKYITVLLPTAVNKKLSAASFRNCVFRFCLIFPHPYHPFGVFF